MLTIITVIRGAFIFVTVGGLVIYWHYLLYTIFSFATAMKAVLASTNPKSNWVVNAIICYGLASFSMIGFLILLVIAAKCLFIISTYLFC